MCSKDENFSGRYERLLFKNLLYGTLIIKIRDRFAFSIEISLIL
jgi:hypothetical protein